MTIVKPHKVRVYLDNCCFNRPFDDQRQIRIRLETEAKLYIQDKISKKELEMVWSYILDYENEFNPFEERKNSVKEWKKFAIIDVEETKEIIDKATKLKNLVLKVRMRYILLVLFMQSANTF